VTTQEQVNEVLGDYRHYQKELRSQIVQICWSMRGSISRDEAWALSVEERKEIFEFVEERMKIVESSRLPLI
jgi:hypothetical protein